MPRPKKSQIDRKTKSFPRVPCSPEERLDLTRIAAKRGYGKKLAPYIRECCLRESPADQNGMSVDEVMRNLADIGRAMGNLDNPKALSEILDRIAKRHMDVIKPKT